MKPSTHLTKLQHRSGLFSASHLNVSTGYNLAWIRDNLYESFGMETINPKKAVKVLHALFEVFLKHENKIDWAIREKPKFAYQYIHARYDPDTLEEIHGVWGNKQNEAIGGFLFRVAELESKGYKVIRNEHDKRILQKLVYYLESIQYWQDKDNGMWEENEEVHASSVGACVAGLRAISYYVFVPFSLIMMGKETLKRLLPNESKTKKVDLALLSLIYPYNVVNKETAKTILNNVEKHLVRKKGVIRYKGDKYYNKNGEAEWVFGFPWLAIIYKKLNKKKYNHYIKKTKQAMNKKGELPELYFANTNTHNENSPLGWAQALYLVATTPTPSPTQ